MINSKRSITTYGSTESNPRTTSASFPLFKKKKDELDHQMVNWDYEKTKYIKKKKRRKKEKEPLLSGTDKEVMVAPKLEILTCMDPLFSSKIPGVLVFLL